MVRTDLFRQKHNFTILPYGIFFCIEAYIFVSFLTHFVHKICTKNRGPASGPR